MPAAQGGKLWWRRAAYASLFGAITAALGSVSIILVTPVAVLCRSLASAIPDSLRVLGTSDKFCVVLGPSPKARTMKNPSSVLREDFALTGALSRQFGYVEISVPLVSSVSALGHGQRASRPTDIVQAHRKGLS